jgi:hypothetical protein
MEKRKPTYDLGSFQDVARRGAVAVTRTPPRQHNASASITIA